MDPYGNTKDNLCMCKPGYYASDTSWMRSSYLGDYSGWEFPILPDRFRCNFCTESVGQFCPGGVYQYFQSSDLSINDDFYRECPTCPSGYRRVPLSEVNPSFLDAVALRFSMANPSGKAGTKHAPLRHCKIFGQKPIYTANAPYASSCACPAGSYVAYSYGVDPQTRCPGSPLYVQVPSTDATAIAYAAIVCTNVWNLDKVGTFIPPEVLAGYASSYFGSCNCLDGYYRPSGVQNAPLTPDKVQFFFAPCVTCPANAYCTGGVYHPCEAGWSTAWQGISDGTGSSSPTQCKYCDTCKAGRYCRFGDSVRYNDPRSGPCTQCGAGVFCSRDNMAAPDACINGYKCPADVDNKAPTPCEDGTYSDVAGLAACKSCGAGNLVMASNLLYCPSDKPILAGTFSKQTIPAGPVTKCTPCYAGTYQDETGKSSCKPCDAPGTYQDEQGMTSCKTCPKGYRNRADAPPLAHVSLIDACEPCPAGTYNPYDGSGKCTPCPVNTYSGTTGRWQECEQCPVAGQVTAGYGSQSASDCFCPPGQFDSRLGLCTSCGKCGLNEYMVSPCNKTSDIVCATCDSCSDRQSFVKPSTMCDGRGDKQQRQQACQWCRTEDTCSGQANQQSGTQSYVRYSTLFKCLSGETSYDTTVCIPSDRYKNPLNFQCPEGKYLKTFDPAAADASADGSASKEFEGNVWLNPNNTFVAEVVPVIGVLRIFASRSVYEPLQVGTAPVIAVEQYLMDDGTRNYTFRCTVSLGDSVRSFTFLHPMSGASSGIRRDVADISGQYAYGGLASTGTWSVDGTAFFMVWMDGTISKAVVWPAVSDFRAQNWWKTCLATVRYFLFKVLLKDAVLVRKWCA